ncbi:hypothetical protein COT93_01695 [Candidatus Falkowbacteria bacterium CG10_big_fil_rev_8_21_14_0_10_37_18]|uniref:Uncharacterized protein n=1 Tax=Candidatus Falkowbacteria bacterium CG10_big_fil_rev_8_21_14_0_10_37_18 TaxID=1974562 RepID=A0A2H0V971_9BACT|nr:hypothetical protein [Candidatus Falkowbacteria bacterium]PIR95625.1 MAG: hypothetical protein COT93_01695 [Candidatus Falkowbacteria bacterium CG10_big_fil_rev_8_21_14_0_10_37_18]
MVKEKVYFWPQWFAASLLSKDRQKIKLSQLKSLGQANLYLWRALNIYDDFLDGTGQAKLLPGANSYYRKYLEIYYRLNLPPKFYQLFNKINDELDNANRQEVSRPKLKIQNNNIILPSRLSSFKNLTDLSKKSLALGLGPIAIMFLNNPKVEMKNIRSVLSFFRKALATKQLSDDTRDWLEDLKNGAITAANIHILKAAKHRKISLNIKKEPEIIYLLFVESTVRLSSQLEYLCQKTRQAGEKAGLANNSLLLNKIIKPIETGVRETAAFRALLN